MRNTKQLVYASSYDRLDTVGLIMYNRKNEKRISVRPLFQNVFRLSESEKRAEGFLFSNLQTPMEQDSNGSLERKKDVGLIQREDVSKSRRCQWQKQSQMEGWKESRQNWVYPCFDAGTSIFRLPRLCEGTSFSNREGNRKSTETRRSSTPHKS